MTRGGNPPKRLHSAGTRAVPARSGAAMAAIKALALLPFLGILVGVPLLDRVMPLVLGLPLLLAWLLLWIVLTSAIMAVIYLVDPANRGPEA